MNVLLVFLTQLIYSLSDLGKKVLYKKIPFGWNLFTDWKFIAVTLFAGLGFLIQLYVLKHYDLSRTIILLAVFAVVLSAIFGAAVLHEKISPLNIVGIAFAILAIILVQIK